MNTRIKIVNRKKDRNYSQFCSICLSINRKLCNSKELTSLFQKYFSDIKMMTAQLYLCWECSSVLRSFQKFQKKAETSQKLIKLYYQGSMPTAINSLSTLTKIVIEETNTIKDENDKEPTLQADADGTKVEIKLEDTADEVDNDYTDNTYDNEHNDVYKDNMEFKEDLVEQNDVYKDNKEFKEDSPFKDLLKKQKKDKKVIKKQDAKKGLSFEYAYVKKAKDYIKNVRMGEAEFKDLFNSHKGRKDVAKNIMDNPFICVLCLVKFDTTDLLNEHTKEHYTNYECDICKFRSHIRREVFNHVTTHLDIVKCLDCGMMLSNKRKYLQHKKTAHQYFYCDHCPAKKKSKQKIQRHIESDHKANVCAICNLTCKNLRTFRDHFKKYHVLNRNEEAFCVLCNKQFDNPYLFRIHVNSSSAHAHERKSSKKVHPCPDCGKTYTRHYYMTNHYLFVHKNQARFECEYCGKKCLNRTRYLTHKTYKHEGKQQEKNKLCTICGRGFQTTRILENHIRTHTGERPFECDYCPSKFGQKVAMVTHIRNIHMKTKRKGSWQQ